MDRIDYLSGVSRQRADHALKALQPAALARIEYGGSVVRLLADLRNYGE